VKNITMAPKTSIEASDSLESMHVSLKALFMVVKHYNVFFNA
jgi:hypothetical protein